MGLRTSARTPGIAAPRTEVARRFSRRVGPNVPVTIRTHAADRRGAPSAGWRLGSPHMARTRRVSAVDVARYWPRKNRPVCPPRRVARARCHSAAPLGLVQVTSELPPAPLLHFSSIADPAHNIGLFIDLKVLPAICSAVLFKRYRGGRCRNPSTSQAQACPFEVAI